MMRLKPDDEISGACLVNEDDTLCLAKQDGSFLHTSVRAIRFGNKNGAGNKFSFLTKQKVSKELREKFKQAADPAKARKEFLQKSKPYQMQKCLGLEGSKLVMLSLDSEKNCIA